MQRERPGRADVYLAVILAALSLVEVAVIDREPRGFVLAVLMALPLAWRRIAPLLVALVISGSLAAFVRVAGEGNDYVFIVVTIVLSMYSVGAFLAIRASVAGLLATAAVVAIGVQASEVSSTGDYLFILFLFGAPWVAGRIARRQYAATAAAERRAADAVADERARVARELHDVVAHSVGLIVVQAGAAEQVIDRDPAAAREALATIRTTGKAALVDLRHMLGLLRSDGDPPDLVHAVRVVSRGDALLAPQVTRRLVERFMHGRQEWPQLAELTARERDVLLAIARGCSNAEIGAELYLSEGTVKTHVTRMLQKLGIRDRVQAVVVAYESGLVTPGEGVLDR